MSVNLKIKEGSLLQYKKGFFTYNWKSNYVTEADSGRPTDVVFLRKVYPRYTCIGHECKKLYVRCPPLPPGSTIQNLVGIRVNPKDSKVHWILFPSEQILNLMFTISEWMTGINSTLPQRSRPRRNVAQRFQTLLNILQFFRFLHCIFSCINCDDGGDDSGDGGGGCLCCGGDEENEEDEEDDS
uniref:PH domain-containing protein n=1 Tax=Meloidogyne hapla TaxID=6305 RepID=A0A1I8BB83_MELHA